jgi:hypothetical protein
MEVQMKRLIQILVIGALVVVLTTLASAQVPQMINYQGKLTTSAGAPVNDTLQMVFTIYADEAGTTPLWTETQTAVEILKGVFNVLLGSVNPISYSVFDGSTRYLGVQVGGDPEITPRKKIVSVSYAYKSFEADTADYARAGAGGDNDWVFPQSAGGTNPRPYLYTYGPWGIARYGNTLYGANDSTHVNLGVACTTGTSGENYKYCTVGGGGSNSASGPYATVGGGRSNTASGGMATVGGGDGNTASGFDGTVGGGGGNTASLDYATVGGGAGNTASGEEATVGGGWSNTASGEAATVGGGQGNTASGDHATVGGGWSNTASGTVATVGGGGSNTARGDFATVGGGYINTASEINATVGGGQNNKASALSATVPGGWADTAGGDYSFAAGDRVRITSAGDYTFAFGSNFTTSASHAVIFHDSGTPIKVGIGTTSPTERLDVAGTAQMTDFKMPTGASNGYVLTSDASGVGTWQAAAGGDNDWIVDATDGDTTLFTGGAWGIARYGNVLYGTNDSTHVNLGVACTTGTSGQNYKYCAVGGGFRNTASVELATVGGGARNTASGYCATVGGGYGNIAIGFDVTVGGGFGNAAGLDYASVGGGYGNTASGERATVGGGFENTASGYSATVGGGWSNTASGEEATVGGGYADTASGRNATVGGGYFNTASEWHATVGGGDSNTASGYEATVGGGYSNTASGLWATVGGGGDNTASGVEATVGGGQGNTASVLSATVPGGYADTAGGDYSFAAGDRVRITSAGDYTFAFGSNFTTSASHAVIFHDTDTPIKVGIQTTTPNTTTDINGDIAWRAGSFSAVNGSNNNISIGARSFVRITGPNAAFSITGIAGGQDGKIVILYNTTAQNMTIANNNANSLAGNRIYTMTGLDEATVGTGNITLIYDATDQKWIVTAIKP